MLETELGAVRKRNASIPFRRYTGCRACNSLHARDVDQRPVEHPEDELLGAHGCNLYESLVISVVHLL